MYISIQRNIDDGRFLYCFGSNRSCDAGSELVQSLVALLLTNGAKLQSAGCRKNFGP